MKLSYFLAALLTLTAHAASAQCPTNQQEVRVDISTDAYGEETYWKLTDLAGTTVMQGGQGVTLDDNTEYSDSLCIAVGGCYFFEIFDTYGDGIFAPGAYRLYVNETLIASGSDDLQRYAIHVVDCSDSCTMVQNALTTLRAHINGTATQTASQLMASRGIFERFSECLATSETLLLLAKGTVADYDQKVGAMFTTPNTQNGFSKNLAAAPGLEMQRAMLALQQGIFDHVFTPESYAQYPQHIAGWKFNSCTAFPGNIAPPTDPTINKTVQIRANFADPDGSNPYFDINNDRMVHALRPTGLYLAPGSVATVTVPDSLVGKDYWVRVGSHDWDLTERATHHRLDRISKKFPIDSTTLSVYNPMGGAISVLVPYLADDSIVQVSVKNGVEAPFFSWKTFHKTVDFSAELAKPAPWAIFETDNVMYTIPKHSIVPGAYPLKQTLLQWDTALQAVNSVMARQIIPDKHNMYMIADVDIRFEAYSIGYPMSNTPLNYRQVPGPAYFIDGPGPDDETNFHESGHALAMSKFEGEEEALVNFPYVMALNHGLGQDLNEAFNYSFVPNTFGIDNTATHRMVSNTFGSARDISNTTTNEVRYQHRGYGHYTEIVHLFGWCPLRNFWKQEHLDFENGINDGINDQNHDRRIVRLCIGAQADLRPLFHVYGLIAKDSIKVQDTLAQLGIKPSPTVYDRLQTYFTLIPPNKAAFTDYALGVYPDLLTSGPNEHPDYGVGWHYLKSLAYNEVQAQQRTQILQSIVARYFPDGKPAAAPNPDVCCLLDTLQISTANQQIAISGGVAPYQITIDTLNLIQTITVTDFDGCATSTQTTSSSTQHPTSTDIRIYPNPTSAQIYVDFPANSTIHTITDIQLISANGQVVQAYATHQRVIDASALNAGVYLLQIRLASGERVYKRVVVL
jgi:N-terminal domain of M60-like peptidases/Secretion system C-terminal sorting domain